MNTQLLSKCCSGILSSLLQPSRSGAIGLVKPAPPKSYSTSVLSLRTFARSGLRQPGLRCSGNMILWVSGVFDITQPQIELSRVDESVNVTEQITKTQEMKEMIMRRASGSQIKYLL
ncbi:predicted protein [Histoplasma mississippiense (nom. inval.)]|uniref:predicted protein n=1 Tax=Ajellomyces capsulatus (strain NAm1 / WU24) TaxID=2059318 RepID=UPI000157C8DF|nr:predicted protein [Histoplasma mississippiense (nom. inval.)]EDN08980.1 predicted protein [Histoplasma mississippiense (nom. inval.)]